MGQRPKALTPLASGWHFLGAELRRWREFRHLSAAQLAGRLFVSPDLVVRVEKAQRRAYPDLIGACDTALDTGGALARLLEFITHIEAPEPEPAPATTALPVELTIKVTAEVVTANPADRRTETSGAPGGARIYPFPAGRAPAGDGA
jgi:transcriptional regulator with XRE-family HTH domain